MSLAHIDVTTDAGWIIPSPETKNYVKMDKATEFLQFEPESRGNLIALVLQVGSIEHHYSRSYKKIQGVLAEVGGLANVAIAIILIVTSANDWQKQKQFQKLEAKKNDRYIIIIRFKFKI